MGFVTSNIVVLRGGLASDRERAADLIVGDLADSHREFGDGELKLAFAMDSSTPEDEIILLAKQFPDMEFAVCYATIDGGFSGWLRAAGDDYDCGSDDFGEGSATEIEKKYGGDGVAWALERYAIELGLSDPPRPKDSTTPPVSGGPAEGSPR